MKRLQALRAKQAELKKKGNAILDAADKESRDLTAEEETSFSAIETELKEVEASIAAAERDAERRRTMAFEAPADLPGLPTSGNIQVGADRASLDPRQGFASYAEFARSVRRASPGPQQGVFDSRLQSAVPSATHLEHGQDGYLVPPEFRDRIWELVWSGDGLLSQIDSEPTNFNAVNDTVDESTPWGTSGIKAYWRSEAQQMIATRQNLKPRSIVLHELYAFVTATDELLEDAPRLENRLSVKAAEAINYRIDETIFEGDGNGKPLGFLNGAALISQAKETSQTATTFNATNAAKMFSRLLSQNIGNAVWLMNSDVLPQLVLLTIGDQPVWTPPSEGMKGAPGGYLLGRPVKFSQHCATLGTVNDIILADLKGYYGLVKGGIKSASSIHLYFDYATTAFRHTFRMGGQPHLSAAISPKNGSTTQGHFIVLATRS